MLKNMSKNVQAAAKFFFVQLLRIILLINGAMLLREKAWVSLVFAILLIAIVMLPNNKFPTFSFGRKVLVFIVMFILMIAMLPDNFVQK